MNNIQISWLALLMLMTLMTVLFIIKMVKMVKYTKYSNKWKKDMKIGDNVSVSSVSGVSEDGKIIKIDGDKVTVEITVGIHRVNVPFDEYEKNK